MKLDEGVYIFGKTINTEKVVYLMFFFFLYHNMFYDVQSSMIILTVCVDFTFSQ